MFKTIAILTIVYLSVAECNDIRIGYVQPQSKKIYSEIKEANPALWTRTDDVIINAPGNELITAVYVTDLRDDKDGEAYIESGGVGTKSVTVRLKSPSILRGYKFEIEVYASDPNARYYYSKGGALPVFDASVQYPVKY
ncbi:uncharacterized protein LOC114357618 [Ostrinia furnacalis]|uniref:uncharacterized protein LOC114357618 n=1 Tax=Ostrinia furnacalis TaxID=93504 RepID=UPI00103AE5ED|nr:uncharacterized protein LOC114357618 [Ostrinia furnacalis]